MKHVEFKHWQIGDEDCDELKRWWILRPVASPFASPFHSFTHVFVFLFSLFVPLPQ